MKKTLLNTIVQRIGGAALAALCFAPVSNHFAQVTEPQTVIVGKPNKLIFGEKYKKQGGLENSDEKSIVVDARVNISLCVRQGNLKINGWDRDEIRAFVAGGSNVDFKIQEKNKQDKVILLMVVGSDPRGRATSAEQCLSGRDIELDVPREAVVNVKGRTSRTTIETVRKVSVKNLGGDISLNNIEQGIQAATYEGDVVVENSGGAIALETTNGNIVAFDVEPSEIGDVFRAKTTSGAVTLQNIAHRQTEINSNSGAIRYTGEFLNGGQYIFNTQNGSISLAIPEKSSCKINASYGYGAFNSEIKLNVITIDNTSKAQSLAATLGNGDANVSLTTYSGAIRIRKQ